MKELTTCKRHSNLLLDEPINLDQDKTRHCPCCGRQSSTGFRPYDEYDLLANIYGVTREAIQTINQVRQQGFPKSESLQEFMRLDLQLSPKISHGYTPNTISCRQCKAIFRFHYVEEGGAFTSPKHCIFCGSDQIHQHPQDSELDYWEILARSYNQTPSTIKLFYDMFTQQRQYSHFNEFMKMLKRQLVESKTDD